MEVDPTPVKPVVFMPERRRFLTALTAQCAASLLPVSVFAAASNKLLTKPIPASGEQLPVIGMGTWITFNVGNDISARNARTEVLQTFFRLGGGMVDSSPMYGSAEAVMGYALQRLGQSHRNSCFPQPKSGHHLMARARLKSLLICGISTGLTCTRSITW